MAVIYDLREHLKNKGIDEYRELLTGLITAETNELMAEVDKYESLGDNRHAERAKRTLMTIFALVEQVPWLQALCTAATNGKTFEMRCKDAILENDTHEEPQP